MPTYTFRDRQAKAFSVPEGDYVFGVKAAVLCISKAGNEQIDATLEILGPKLTENQRGVLAHEYMQFIEQAEWKIDLFLKCIKRQPKKGESLEITDEWLQEHAVGALGWAHFTEEKYQKTPDAAMRISNKVGQFLVNMKQDAYEAYKLRYEPQPKPDDDIPL